jgi:UDP-glucose 4-epimerase
MVQQRFQGGKKNADPSRAVPTIPSEETASMEQTYLITGGVGFIGSHLAQGLLDAGHTVVVLDDLSTGQLDNLREIRSEPRLHIEIGSVLDDLKVDQLVHRCDVVVHLAAAVGVKLIVEQPLRSFTTNIRGSEIVIGAAHRYRRKILVASTSEIYGKNGADKLEEDADRILGASSVSRWAYSTAKAVDEILALMYHRERDLQAIVARLFNTVGPRQSPGYGMVLPRLVRQAVAGEPLSVYGDGLQSRCFCHVLDVVAALVGLLEHPDAVGGVFNVGSSYEISILDLARRVIARSGSTSDIELIPYEQAYADGFEDMRRRVPDTAKLSALTGWAPRRSLDDILDDAIAEAEQESRRPGRQVSLDLTGDDDRYEEVERVS